MDKREIAEMTGEMVQRYYNNDIIVPRCPACNYPGRF